MKAKKRRIRFIIFTLLSVFSTSIYDGIKTWTGSWATYGQFALHIAKLVRIIIGAILVIGILLLAFYEYSERDDVDKCHNENERLRHDISMYKDDNKSLSEFIGFSSANIADQLKKYKNNDVSVDDSALSNLVWMACSNISKSFHRMFGEDADFSISIYQKYRRNGKQYCMMVAHEGDTRPKYWKTERSLDLGDDNYYVEKLMRENKVDPEKLLYRDEVCKAFNISPDDQMHDYYQFLGIPIVSPDINKVVLYIEIDVHGQETIDENDIPMINNHLRCYKDYLMELYTICRCGKEIQVKKEEILKS